MEEKSDVLKLFYECVRTFTTQPLDVFFYEDSNGQTLLVQDGAVWTWNESHPFWTDHRETMWAFREIGDVFLREYAMYQAKHYSGFNKNAFIKKVRTEEAQQLMELLQALVGDIDLELFTALSHERYESVTGAGLEIVLIPYPIKLENIEELNLFSKVNWIRLSYQNVHALRKYLNMAQSTRLAVCYTDGLEGNDFYAVGLLPGNAQNKFPWISFPGHMEWRFCLPPVQNGCGHVEAYSGCRIRCMQGRLFLPLLNSEDYERRKIQKALETYPVPKGKNINDYVGNVLQLVQQIKSQKKGALLIVSDEKIIQLERDRLCEINCGIGLEGDSWSKSKSELLIELSSIDGAVLVDWEGNFWACGVILDGMAAKGDISRGSRYNSARSYLAYAQTRYVKSSLLGVVVSEDGMVDFLIGKELNGS